MTFLILCTAVLSRLFGQEDPCGIVVCTPRRILSPLVGPLSCSLDVSTLHHSRRHRRAGVWGRARRVSARGRLGGLACGGTEPWGLDPGSALGPLILPPHSLFWSFCWRLCGDPLDVEGVYKAYSPRRIHRLAPELPQGLCMCCLCPLFSFSSTASPSATLWLHKHIFLCVTPVDGTISVSYSESFYCSPNLPCDEFLGLPAGAPHMRPLPRCWAGCLPRCGQGGWWLRGGDRGGREATAAAPPGGMVN